MIRNLSANIARSWISAQIQDHVWVVPTFQSIHILAIAALIFASFSVDVVVLRSPTSARAIPWLGSSYRWTWAALTMLLVSGTILTTGEPARSLMNLFFRIKVVLVLAAAGLTLVLQRSLTGEGRSPLSNGALAVLAALSILLWVTVLFCGRFIAYFGDLAG